MFQDGGILALGRQHHQHGDCGRAGGLPAVPPVGRGPPARAAIFAGGALSVLVSAVLALAELLISGVRMPASVLGVSLALFLVSAVIEGAITLAVMQALEAIQPNFVRQAGGGPAAARWGRRALAAVLLAAVGVLFASAAPDGIQQLGLQTGIAAHARALFSTPFSGLRGGVPGRRGWLRKAARGTGRAWRWSMARACCSAAAVARHRSP